MAKRAKRNPFREAKQYLWNGVGGYYGKVDYICWALENVDGKNARVAKRMVERRLDGLPTVYSFLWNQKGIKRNQLTTRNVQAYRHRWLDHLADEWDRGVRK